MTGLRAPSMLGAGAAEQQEIHNAWDTFDDAEIALFRMGFPPVNKPGSARPTITPGTLSKLTGHQITELFEQVGSWHDYAVNTLARHKGRLLQITNEKNDLAVTLRQGVIAAAASIQDKKPSDASIKEMISQDPRYKQLTQIEQIIEQQRYQLEGHVDSLYRQLKLVSRQVEIRRQELEGLNGGRGFYKQPSR